MSNKEVNAMIAGIQDKENNLAAMVRSRVANAEAVEQAKIEEKRKQLVETERLCRATGVVAIFEHLRDSQFLVMNKARIRKEDVSFLGINLGQRQIVVREAEPAILGFFANPERKGAYLYFDDHIIYNEQENTSGPRRIEAVLSLDGNRVNEILADGFKIKVEDNLVEAVGQAVMHCKGLI